MTRDERIDLYRRMIEMSEEAIAFDSDHIMTLNEIIADCRREDRRLVEYVWSKGVVTADEMRLFNKGFMSRETKDWIKCRRRAYKCRSRSRKSLEYWTKELKRESGR